MDEVVATEFAQCKSEGISTKPGVIWANKFLPIENVDPLPVLFQKLMPPDPVPLLLTISLRPKPLSLFHPTEGPCVNAVVSKI